MPFLEAIRLALSSILAHKLRSFLTLLGVIFGVATVIVVVSLIEGFNSYVDEKIANIGTNAFAVQKYSIDDFPSVEALNAARRRDILKQFLAESTLLPLVGGVIGVSLAYLLATLVSTFTSVPTALPLFAVAAALLVPDTVGLVSGVYPAWKAAGLDPIEALRYE